MTPADLSIPSISHRRIESSRGVTSSAVYMSRRLAIESISSMNRMHGARSRAVFRRSATRFPSDSPYHLLIRSEHLIEIISTPSSLASAFISIVFPQPGGPNRRIPFGGSSLNRVVTSFRISGMIIDSLMSAFTSWSPPTISNVVFVRPFISATRVPTLVPPSREVKNASKASRMTSEPAAAVIIPGMNSRTTRFADAHVVERGERAERRRPR